MWARSITEVHPAQLALMRGEEYPLTPAPTYGEELGKFYRREASEIGGLADELAELWRATAAGVSV